MGVARAVGFVRFGPFQLDLRAGELRRNGIKVRVPDQSIKVLEMLVEHSGEVVTREELHEQLWPNGTIVEFDRSINAAVKRLRQALEDTAEAPKFIETLPRRGYRFLMAVDVVAPAEAPVSPTSEPCSGGLVGQTISHYRVVTKLGQGSMGVVYEAEDTKLGRRVALKFLPEELSDDLRSLERFEREARAASALNHPNICTIHEVDEHEGVRFIAMEYVAGKSLDQVIGPQGLPLKDVVIYAIQIADALARAHSARIIHRDLKPSNIMVRQDGLVKLLDFGLAKMHPAKAAVAGTMATETTPLTSEGTLLGTLQYMAPEQLEGKEADARTDIFAFGAVLYEMASGKTAFTGKSHASLISAIMSSEPAPITTVSPMTPPALQHVVGTCLAKEPEARWQTAHDVLVQLKWIAESGTQDALPAAIATRPKTREVWLLGLAGILALALGTVSAIHWREKPREESPIRFQVAAPEKAVLDETDSANMAVSPNGRRLVFTASVGGGRPSLWLRPLDSDEARELPGTQDAQYTFWAPDGRSLAFWADGKLKRIEINGGLPQVLADAPDFSGGSWNPNGIIIFTSGLRGLLYSIDATGGEAKALWQLNRTRNERPYWPYFLPDGRHFLYMTVSAGAGPKRGMYLGSLDSKESRFVASENEIVGYSAPGFLLFSREFNLFAQRFDVRKFELMGEPASIARVSAASTSANGILAYRRFITSNPVQIAWYGRDGKRQAPIGDPGPYDGIALSPDNTRLTVEKINPETGNHELWLLELSSGIFSRLTSVPATGSHWSSDNRQIVFGSYIKGPSDLYRKTIGEGEAEPIFESEEAKFPEDWLDDGSIIVIDVDGHTFYRLPLGERRLQVLFRTPFWADEPHVSPDRHWIAYDSNESGRWEIYLASFPAFTGRRQVSIAGGGQPRWRKDGRELFYLSPDGKLMSIDVKPGGKIEIGVPKALFQTPVRMDPRADQYCVTADGRRFIVMEYLPDVSPISVVVNWPALLQ